MTGLKQFQVERFKRHSAKHPLITVVLPILVWISAVGAALWLYQGIGTRDTILGYAEDRPVTLAHLDAGVVRDLRIGLHDRVQRGQLLLSLDDTAEQLALRVIQADVERLKESLEAERLKYLADNARAETDVEDLERRFLVERETAQIAYLEALRLDAEAKATLRGQLVEFDIVKNLYEKETANFREFNLLQTQIETLKARIEHNGPWVERLKKAYEDSDLRWASFQPHQDVAIAYDRVLTPIRLEAETRLRELDELVHRIDGHVVRAPIDGQVTSLFAKPGDCVVAGLPLVAISPVQTQRIVAYLPENETFAIRVGDKVMVQPIATAGGRAKVYPALVESLSATVGEAPPRFRHLPTMPVWGREMVVRIDSETYLMPGEGAKIIFGWQ